MGETHSICDVASFKDISADVLEELATHGQTQTFEMGHLLFERAQEANDLMLLQEGAVDLFFPLHVMGVTRELTMESKHAGDMVAWSALVSPYRFRLSGRCTSRCVITCFNRDDLLTFFDAHTHCGYLFMRNLAGVVGRRLQNMQNMWIHDLQASAVKHLES